MSDLPRQDIILVVDDSADSLNLISDALEEAGISVLVALDGQQAITIAQRLRPDMILMDAIMPKMGGFEACRRLKADPELADIPVIFMTGLAETEDIVQGLEAGGVDYLTKPIRPAELLARMKVHLSNARLTQSAHTALDTTGQYLFTVDSQGHLLWATPQVRQQLEQRSIPMTEQAALIQQWLQKNPQPQQKLPLASAANNTDNLTAAFVEKRNTDEFLLRLSQDNSAQQQHLLQQKLSLTGREAEVLQWLAAGKTNREIGQILGISPRTVNKHLEQVFQKAGVENRTAAASIALRLMSENS